MVLGYPTWVAMDLLHLYGCWCSSSWHYYVVSFAAYIQSLLFENRHNLRILKFLVTNRWAHEICSDDNEERAIVTGSMNQMAYVIQIWLPLVVWQQIEAPKYSKGFATVLFLSVGMLIMTAVTWWFRKREYKQ
jgi:hypothetical protein